ncbi:glutathione peroxidase [Burkholderia seminalis]|uniref:Glutathione peroxidase n=2 Tax=Burkholderia cepacia complex TaxID=87882 RepID=A0A8A8DHL7_9BURK|nr:glutathione peroxidase [Burkholderia seminalis]QTO24148.1 glutathione peroxidase [Burkholderia seminalis]
MSQSLYDIPINAIDGTATTLRPFEGNVLLIVNVASKCGLTPQYEGLEALYEQKQANGFTVLAFPANDFKAQEPGSNEEIQEFCKATFGVTFPLFAKMSVVGEHQHPLYRALTDAQPRASGDGPFRERLKGYGIEPNPEPAVLWNFEKFLVSRTGEVVARFAPNVGVDDASLVAAIDAELAKRA